MSWLQNIGAGLEAGLTRMGQGLSDGLASYGASSISENTRHIAASPAIDNPMHAIVEEFRSICENGGTAFTLANLMTHGEQKLLQSGLTRDQVGPTLANLSSLDVSGMEMNQQGIDDLREIWPEASEQPIDLRGANISGCVFRPASTVNGILIDCVTVTRSTQMQHVSFDGFTEGAHLSLGCSDISFFEVSGDGSHAAHMTMDFEGTTAQGANIANSRYTNIHARQSEEGKAVDLSGLMADNARALKIDALSCELSGGRFCGASFAPGTQMINCNLIAADFEGAIMSGVDLCGCRLSGANFKGVDLTNVNLKGAELRPQDLQGALFQGQEIGQDIEANAVMQQLGIQPAAENVYSYIDTVEQVVERLDTMREEGLQQRDGYTRGGNATPTSDMAAIAAHGLMQEDEQHEAHVENIPLCETDEFIKLIVKTHNNMQGVQQTQTDMIRANSERSLTENHEANRHRVDHSEEYIGRGNNPVA